MWPIIVAGVAFFLVRCSNSHSEDGGTPTADAGVYGGATVDAGEKPVLDAGHAARDAGFSKDAGTKDGGPLKPPDNEVSHYVPPAHPIFPQTTSTGINHFQFLENGTPTHGSYPLILKCSEPDMSCYFGMGNKLYSFSSDSLNSNADRDLAVAADFSADIDGQTAIMASAIKSENNYYGMYDTFDAAASPGPGIAIRDNNGAPLATYYFPLVDGTPITTPNSMQVSQNRLWASASNYVGGDDIYRAGTLFSIDINEDGTLVDDSSRLPLASTQLDPQGLTVWYADNKTYILAINTGKARFNQDGSIEILTESGVDVIDPDADKIIANIPLGLGSANNIVVTPDGAVAFASSQTLSNIYVIDLERLKTKLSVLSPGENLGRVEDVVVADATNPIAINPTGAEFVAAIGYDFGTESLLTANFNAGTLGQIKAGYHVLPGVGIQLDAGFGTVLAQYVCAPDGTMNCSQMDLMRSAVVALTGTPASGTFVPHESLVQQPNH